ncbi:MAG: DinB family protein [Gemmatimonas sp.]
MNALSLIRRLFAHAAWADKLLLNALVTAGARAPQVAWREYAHVLGADAVWLSRLELAPQPLAVWPDLTRDETVALRDQVVIGYEHYLGRADSESMNGTVDYVNTAGQAFSNTPLEILTHVAMHAQYHRGKINQILRQGGSEPAPVDYISYIRGVPAATTKMGSTGKS